MPVDVRGWVRIRALDAVQCPNPEPGCGVRPGRYWAGDVAGQRPPHIRGASESAATSLRRLLGAPPWLRSERPLPGRRAATLCSDRAQLMGLPSFVRSLAYARKEGEQLCAVSP